MALYRSGRLALVPSPVVVGKPFYGWRRHVPMKAVQDVLRASYARAQRLNTPPAGEPFNLDGKPYATSDEFVDDLVDEFRTQLHRFVSAGKGGNPQQ